MRIKTSQASYFVDNLRIASGCPFYASGTDMALSYRATIQSDFHLSSL